MSERRRIVVHAMFRAKVCINLAATDKLSQEALSKVNVRIEDVLRKVKLVESKFARRGGT